jgi:hypothetical protein
MLAASSESTSKPIRSLCVVGRCGGMRNDVEASAVVTTAHSNTGIARPYECQHLLQLHAPRALEIDGRGSAAEEGVCDECSSSQKQKKYHNCSRANSAACICGARSSVRENDKGKATAAHCGV